jgi:ribose 5-phosphate isomerase B
MKIAIASDHAGFLLKEEMRDHVRGLGHQVVDLGAFNAEPSDYPDFAAAVGKELMAGRVERGILICGSGVGVCIAANKMPGVRACMCHDNYSAHQGVEHDEMNVLVLGARIIGSALATELIETYLHAKFIASEPRFVRRLHKVLAIESKYMPSAAASASNIDLPAAPPSSKK